MKTAFPAQQYGASKTDSYPSQRVEIIGISIMAKIPDRNDLLFFHGSYHRID